MHLAILLLGASLASASAQSYEWPNGEYNPFGHSPIRIRLDMSNLTGEAAGYAAEGRAALRFWEEGGNGRLEWRVAFAEVGPDDAPDIVMWFRDATRAGPTCEEAEAALGCARPFERPVSIEVLLRRSDGALRSYSQVREVSEHELGHALGLPHSADPNDLMRPHASRAAAGTWAPGDLARLAGGALVVLAIIGALGSFLVRATRPKDVGAVHLLQPGPCPSSRDGEHEFQDAAITTTRGDEEWLVCEHCKGGRRK